MELHFLFLIIIFLQFRFFYLLQTSFSRIFSFKVFELSKNYLLFNNLKEKNCIKYKFVNFNIQLLVKF